MEPDSATDNLSVDENSSIFETLRNELIMKIISGFLSFENVKNFRLAHSQSNLGLVYLMRQMCDYINLSDKKSKRFLQHLESQFPDKFTSDSEAQCFINRLSNHDLQSHMSQCLVNLTNLIESSNGFPCSKFKVGGNVNDQALGRFIQVASIFTTELCLERKSSRSSLFQENPNMQFCNLKTLKIKFICVDEDTATAQDLQFFAMIIQNAPNLDTFSLESRDSAKFLTDFLNGLDNRVLKNIRNLAVCGKLEDNHLIKLAEMDLKLSVLSLTMLLLFHRPHPSPRTIFIFLAIQSKHLEELRIEGVLTERHLLVILPEMPNLKVFEIDSSSCGIHRIKFPGIYLNQQCPALQELTLSGHKTDLDFLNSITMENVVKLGFQNDLSDAILIQTANIFPNVKTLKMPAVLDLLKVASREMTKIEELCLSGGNHLFQACTGLTKTEWNINSNRNNDDLQEYPLAILNNVKILRLQNIHVTDFVCYHGLMKLRHLKHLDLWNNTRSEISKLVLEHMRTKFTVLLKDNCIIPERKSDLDLSLIQRNSD